MISTALAATLVDEYGDEAPLLEAGGRALREMTRISSSPYSMWRDIAITNKQNIQEAFGSIVEASEQLLDGCDELAQVAYLERCVAVGA